MKGFRYWLADLISGGELTHQTDGWRLSEAYHHERYKIARDRANRLRDLRAKMAVLEVDNRNGWANSKLYSYRLKRIAALETPSANATVRKMARIARGDA